MVQLNKRLGLELEKITRFEEAMTHSSCEGELNNKKLAFLGDVILELSVSLYILQKYPQLSVGEMTEKRASIVNSRFLSKKAKEWKLNELLKLGKGERQTGGEAKETILAEAVEALLGAIYLDYGYKNTENFIERNIIPEEIELEAWNIKGRLQELTLSKDFGLPEYSIIQEIIDGTDRLFEVHVKINGKVLGYGKGRNKKEAEEFAAKNALEALLTECRE